MFQRKFHRWMKKLGKAKTDVAIGRSLLTVIYVMLKEDRPYREADPKQMHEMERSKLIRHHAKRWRKLGVDEQLINQKSIISMPSRRSAPRNRKSRPSQWSRRSPRLPGFPKPHLQKHAKEHWDSGLAKQGNSNIRFSKTRRRQLLRRRDLDPNVNRLHKTRNKLWNSLHSQELYFRGKERVERTPTNSVRRGGATGVI